VGIGPVFLKLFSQVRYRLEDIEAFEESCLATSTGTALMPYGVKAMAALRIAESPDEMVEMMVRSSFLVRYGLSWTHSKEIDMAVNVKLPETLVETAKRYGTIEHRSVPKQIEYWSQIGKIAAENPDLPFSVIRDILIADQEEPVGEYPFG